MICMVEVFWMQHCPIWLHQGHFFISRKRPARGFADGVKFTSVHFYVIWQILYLWGHPWHAFSLTPEPLPSRRAEASLEPIAHLPIVATAPQLTIGPVITRLACFIALQTLPACGTGASIGVRETEHIGLASLWSTTPFFTSPAKCVQFASLLTCPPHKARGANAFSSIFMADTIVHASSTEAVTVRSPLLSLASPDYQPGEGRSEEVSSYVPGRVHSSILGLSMRQVHF